MTAAAGAVISTQGLGDGSSLVAVGLAYGLAFALIALTIFAMTFFWSSALPLMEASLPLIALAARSRSSFALPMVAWP